MEARVAVLASGVGSNLQALLDDTVVGRRISLVVSDQKDAHALERARDARVPDVFLDPKKHGTRSDYDHALLELLRARDITHVVLAGFMRILGPEIVQSYKWRILNIHPALLPAFPGSNAVGDAIAWGVKVTGVTVHFVDEEVDHGPVVLQESLPILRTDDEWELRARIQALEHRIYRVAVRALLEDRIEVFGRYVTIDEAGGR
jgi:phosphoribosylglycinamide formyltransferase 1